jgi:hypothetical protein
MRRTNDLPLADPRALYEDRMARLSLLRDGRVATMPGALAEAERAIRPNDIYDTDLRLIFYDEPIFGHYQEWFDRIFAERRYTDLRANLAYFSALYATVLATPETAASSLQHADDGDLATFSLRYRNYVTRQKDEVDRWLSGLPAGEPG